MSLDLALGGVGVPRGRITEIYGPESSGKTTLCSHIIANAQKAGRGVRVHRRGARLRRRLREEPRVNLDELLVSQPDTGEQALEIAETLIRSNAIDVVVIDSVAALVPKAEILGEMGDSHVGLHARLMSQALRKLSGAIRSSNAAMIFTNQIRMKIGVMFGSPETTTGGNALKFYASVRLDMRRIGTIKGPGDVVPGQPDAREGGEEQDRPAVPDRPSSTCCSAQGINYVGDVLDLAVNGGVVEKSGAWYSFRETRLGQGRDKSIEFLHAQRRPARRDRVGDAPGAGHAGRATASGDVPRTSRPRMRLAGGGKAASGGSPRRPAAADGSSRKRTKRPVGRRNAPTGRPRARADGRGPRRAGASPC